MNRDIKFRGYDPDTKRWYFGSYARLERVSGYAWSDDPAKTEEHHQANNFDDYIFFTEMNDWGLETRKLKATVDRKSVGQYTGLKDKNGTEIYEGDIVVLDMWQGNEHGYIPEDGIIKWHQSSSAFKWFSLEEDLSDANNYWLSEADEKQRELIGNIYENPELLEKAS